MPPERLKLLGGTTINIRKHKLTRYLFNWTNPQTLLFSFFLYILEFPSPSLSLFDLHTSLPRHSEGVSLRRDSIQSNLPIPIWWPWSTQLSIYQLSLIFLQYKFIFIKDTWATLHIIFI